MNEPFVKKFREERELTLMILFDASASNEFGSRSMIRGEAAAEISAVIAFSAVKNNDNVGLMIFTDKVEKYIPPKKGRDHVLKLIRELLYFKTENRKTDINAVLEFALRVQKKKGIFYLISDMYAPDFTQALSIAARKHDLTGVRLIDPAEKSLEAAGLVDLEDSETGEILTVDTRSPLFRRHYRETADLVNLSYKKMFKKRGVDYIEVDLSGDHIDQFVRFNLKKVFGKH